MALKLLHPKQVSINPGQQLHKLDMACVADLEGLGILTVSYAGLSIFFDLSVHGDLYKKQIC